MPVPATAMAVDPGVNGGSEMNKPLKFTAYGVGGLVLLVVGIALIGALLPADHVASVSAHYEQPPDVVWSTITDFEAFPEWRSGVDRVSAMSSEDGWIEYGSTGPMPLAISEAEAPRRLVLRIASDDLPFGGTWTYEIAPVGGGSTLTITENGTVSNPLFRFMSRFVFGHTMTMEAYLTDLGARFGESTTPRGR